MSSAKADLVVPYIATWSEEHWDEHPRVVERPGGSGIAYPDEILADRDQRGILWDRATSRPGHGKPQFARIHPLRQRRAMRKLLCQTCGNPADNTCHGVLWVLRDTGQPLTEHLLVSEPPICLPCARLSAKLCPALRKGHILLRAESFRLFGVDGLRYRTGHPAPIPVDHHVVSFTDPAIRWTLADKLVREIGDYTILTR